MDLSAENSSDDDILDKKEVKKPKLWSHYNFKQKRNVIGIGLRISQRKFFKLNCNNK